jgi:hypothetical protein
VAPISASIAPPLLPTGTSQPSNEDEENEHTIGPPVAMGVVQTPADAGDEPPIVFQKGFPGNSKSSSTIA